MSTIASKAASFWRFWAQKNKNSYNFNSFTKKDTFDVAVKIFIILKP